MNSYAQLCIVIHTYHYIFALLKANCTLKVGLLASVPRPPTRSEGIHSPLQRGGDGGGAVCSVYLAGVAARYLLFFSL